MIVKYTGNADFQVFSAADFKKADLEQNQLKFAKGEPKKVKDEVGQALTSEDGIFGDFSFEEVTDDGEAADNSEADGPDAEDAPTGEGVTPQQGVESTSSTRTAKKAAATPR
jgi:hypothetical protein